MLILDEGVAPRLCVLRRHHHPDALDSAILLKLALQLALTGNSKYANDLSFNVLNSKPYLV